MKEHREGFFRWSTDLEQEFGLMVMSGMAAFVTKKGDRMKRLPVHVLRRSGVGGISMVLERIVLPRRIDAARTTVETATNDGRRRSGTHGS